MLQMVNLLPDRKIYCDRVLNELTSGGDDWDTVQRFHFAANMYFDGDERAKRTMSYEELRPKLLEMRGYALRHWGKQATESDIERAAQSFLESNTPEEQILYLRVFSGRRFPLLPTRMLELSLSDREDLALAAAIALTEIKHPAVREAALRLVHNGLPGRRAAIEIARYKLEAWRS